MRSINIIAVSAMLQTASLSLSATDRFTVGDDTYYLHRLWYVPLTETVGDEPHSMVSTGDIIYISGNQGSTLDNLKVSRISALSGERLEDLRIEFTEEEANDYYLDLYASAGQAMDFWVTTDTDGQLVVVFDVIASSNYSSLPTAKTRKPILIHAVIDPSTGTPEKIYRRDPGVTASTSYKGYEKMGTPVIIGRADGDHTMIFPLSAEQSGSPYGIRTAVFFYTTSGGTSSISHTYLSRYDTDESIGNKPYDTSWRTHLHLLSDKYYVVDDNINNIGARGFVHSDLQVAELPETEGSRGFNSFLYDGHRFTVSGTDSGPQFTLSTWDADISGEWSDDITIPPFSFDGYESHVRMSVSPEAAESTGYEESASTSEGSEDNPWHLSDVVEYETIAGPVAQIHLYYPGEGVAAYQLSKSPVATGAEMTTAGEIWRMTTDGVRFSTPQPWITLTDMHGRTVATSTGSAMISSAGLASGLYILRSPSCTAKLRLR